MRLRSSGEHAIARRTFFVGAHTVILLGRETYFVVFGLVFINLTGWRPGHLWPGGNPAPFVLKLKKMVLISFAVTRTPVSRVMVSSPMLWSGLHVSSTGLTHTPV